ncbi:ankyrin repeat-containing domain protein [Rhexocercosporidium sp. MPI-PUGE-AT-0058]|nr:ankyrin repeat-containing domain protein [Rhexocercosporidium sp. MPI-PUGE-AT-0058]
MEVVAAVSALAGLADLCLKLCKSLNEMRSSFVDAEGAVTALATDFEAFSSILLQTSSRLDESVAKGIQYSTHAKMNLKTIVTSCSTPVVNLQKVLLKFGDFTDLEGRGKAVNVRAIRWKFRWVREENNIVKIQQSLERQKSTLSVQLLVILVGQSDQLIECLEQGLEKLSIDTADAVSEIPAPTNVELAAEIPELRTERSVQISSAPVSGKEEVDDSRSEPAAVPGIVLSPTEPSLDQEMTSQEATLPADSKIEATDSILTVSGDNLSSEDSKSPTPLSKLHEPSQSSSVQTVQAPSPPSQRETLASGHHRPPRSPSPGRKRVPINISIDDLFSAITSGNKNMVLQVLQRGVHVTTKAPDGTTPLQLAVNLNQEEIVLTFLFFGADPDDGGGYEISPLISAIKHDRPSLVKILLEAGADPGKLGVLWHAAAQSLEMVKLCLAKHGDFTHKTDINAFNVSGPYAVNGQTPLSVACGLGKIDVVRFLLEEAGADASVMFNGQCDPKFCNAPLAAIIRQDEPLLALVLAHLPDPNVCNKIGNARNEYSLLHYALHTGKLSIVQTLVEAGVNVNTSFHIWGTALQEACRVKALDMVRYLLDKEADPNITPLDIHPIEPIQCPLHVAVSNGSIELIEMLLDAGANPNRPKGTLWLAATSGRTEIVTRLLQIESLDIDALSSDAGNYAEVMGTALHAAVEKDHVDVLNILLDSGADPNVKTRFLGTPLALAIRKQHRGCVDVLMGGSNDGHD